jgi:hypothetical protein
VKLPPDPHNVKLQGLERGASTPSPSLGSDLDEPFRSARTTAQVAIQARGGPQKVTDWAVSWRRLVDPDLRVLDQINEKS